MAIRRGRAASWQRALTCAHNALRHFFSRWFYELAKQPIKLECIESLTCEVLALGQRAEAVAFQGQTGQLGERLHVREWGSTDITVLVTGKAR